MDFDFFYKFCFKLFSIRLKMREIFRKMWWVKYNQIRYSCIWSDSDSSEVLIRGEGGGDSAVIEYWYIVIDTITNRFWHIPHRKGIAFFLMAYGPALMPRVTYTHTYIRGYNIVESLIYYVCGSLIEAIRYTRNRALSHIDKNTTCVSARSISPPPAPPPHPTPRHSILNDG